MVVISDVEGVSKAFGALKSMPPHSPPVRLASQSHAATLAAPVWDFPHHPLQVGITFRLVTCIMQHLHFLFCGQFYDAHCSVCTSSYEPSASYFKGTLPCFPSVISTVADQFQASIFRSWGGIVIEHRSCGPERRPPILQSGVATRSTGLRISDSSVRSPPSR